jgi:transcriptional regulator with XRE-family HTH domain
LPDWEIIILIGKPIQTEFGELSPVEKKKRPGPTLGALLRGLRHREGWTLKEMSAKSGIPFSTLSKIEHDRLTLSFDKLQHLSQRLGMRMSELFAEDTGDRSPAVTARRSLGDIDKAVRVTTPNYDYYYLCTELRRKRMVPSSRRSGRHPRRSLVSWSATPAKNSSMSSRAGSSYTRSFTTP